MHGRFLWHLTYVNIHENIFFKNCDIPGFCGNALDSGKAGMSTRGVGAQGKQASGHGYEPVPTTLFHRDAAPTTPSKQCDGKGKTMATAPGADDNYDNKLNAWSPIPRAPTNGRDLLPGWRTKFAQCTKYLINVCRSDLLPLEIKCSCIYAGKEMCDIRYECVMRNPGCCFF